MVEKKSINGMLNGLLVLQLIMAVLTLFTGINLLSANLIGWAIFNLIIGGLLLVSGITLRLRWGIGYYLSSILGLIVILSQILSLVLGRSFDILSIILGLILVSVYFNKSIKEEVL